MNALLIFLEKTKNRKAKTLVLHPSIKVSLLYYFLLAKTDYITFKELFQHIL